jgi:hypothetical protein
MRTISIAVSTISCPPLRPTIIWEKLDKARRRRFGFGHGAAVADYGRRQQPHLQRALEPGRQLAEVFFMNVGLIVLKDRFLPETRARVLAIIHRMKEREQIHAVILGGTELPFLLRDDTASGIPLLDTTQIHVQAVVAELLAES